MSEPSDNIHSVTYVAEETETNGAGVQCRDRGCRSAEQCRSRDNAELVLGTSPTGPPSIHNV